MKSKRSKALADKLVDDLLEDEKTGKSSKSKNNAPTSVGLPDATSAMRPTSHVNDEDDLVLNFDSNTRGSIPVTPESDAGYATKVLSEEEDPLPTVPATMIKEQPVAAAKPTSSPKPAPVAVDKDEDDDLDDRTMQLSESRILKTDEKIPLQKEEKQKPKEEVIKAGVGRFAPNRPVGPQSSTEAALARSENLRIAQNRILELEQEVERLRVENEQLAAAGETFRRRSDELLGRAENAEARAESMQNLADEEKKLLQESLEGKERQYRGVQSKIEELEARLSTNIQKIRVRERELENRLELVRMESAALIRSKDELILDLKRQMDQLNMELENYRSKGQELNKNLNDKQEMLRRTVKALRLALSMLEGEDEVLKNQKKAK